MVNSQVALQIVVLILLTISLVLIDEHLLAADSQTFALKVNINGLRSTEGTVKFCLWREKDSGFPNCAKGEPYQVQVSDAATGDTVFQGLTAGKYAVTIIHNEKSEGSGQEFLSRKPTVWQLRKIGFGVSNCKKVSLRNRPDFSTAAVYVPAAGGVSVDVSYPF